ncbi:MAG TPA: permease-like cell division protein FtsX [Longimicrobiales bacterium]|nr:permease-like cell division protein FtsX [Longimicrobiales bacterium]
MYAFREALAAFRRAPVLTGLSSAMVGLALYVVGLFGLATYNLQLALSSIEERVEIAVYLRDDARQSEIDLVLTELAAIPEVRTVTFVSKRDALARAQTELPEFGELFTDLEVNPLPQSLEVELRPGMRDPEVVEKVSQAAMLYPFVEDARYGREWVDKLFTLRRIGAATTAVLGSAFAMVAALIIGTALRIAIFARREEIYVMRLVGAKNGFIRRPFLLEGAMAGLLGGVLAWGLTYATYRGVYSFLFEVAWVPGTWVLLGLAAGCAFGAVSSALAIRRYLQEI